MALKLLCSRLVGGKLRLAEQGFCHDSHEDASEVTSSSILSEPRKICSRDRVNDAARPKLCAVFPVFDISLGGFPQLGGSVIVIHRAQPIPACMQKKFNL